LLLAASPALADHSCYEVAAFGQLDQRTKDKCVCTALVGLGKVLSDRSPNLLRALRDKQTKTLTSEQATAWSTTEGAVYAVITPKLETAQVKLQYMLGAIGTLTNDCSERTKGDEHGVVGFARWWSDQQSLVIQGVERPVADIKRIYQRSHFNEAVKEDLPQPRPAIVEVWRKEVLQAWGSAYRKRLDAATKPFGQQFWNKAAADAQALKEAYQMALFELKYGEDSFRSNIVEYGLSVWLFRSEESISPWEPIVRYNLLQTLSLTPAGDASFGDDYDDFAFAHVARVGVIYNWFPSMEEFKRTGKVGSGAFRFMGGALNIGARTASDSTCFVVGASAILSYLDLGVLWSTDNEWFLTIGASTPMKLLGYIIN